MAAFSPPANTLQDRPGFASRKMLMVPGAVGGDPATLMFWITGCLATAVHGVRSAEVAAQITRHLDRFRDWFADGYGHDRIAPVISREVSNWRKLAMAHDPAPPAGDLRVAPV